MARGIGTRRLDNHDQLGHFLDDEGERLVGVYYNSGTYSGRWFDRIGRVEVGIPDDPHRFTWQDITAVSMLSVHIPPLAAISVVQDSASELSESVTPTNIEIFDQTAAAHLNGESPASELWRRLKRIDGVGWVTAHKLLARKRPALFPVCDSAVKAALQPHHRDFWAPMFQSLRDRSVHERLTEIRSSLELGDEVPLLRVLDVAVWMRVLGQTNSHRLKAASP